MIGCTPTVHHDTIRASAHALMAAENIASVCTVCMPLNCVAVRWSPFQVPSV